MGGGAAFGLLKGACLEAAAVNRPMELLPRFPLRAAGAHFPILFLGKRRSDGCTPFGTTGTDAFSFMPAVVAHTRRRQPDDVSSSA